MFPKVIDERVRDSGRASNREYPPGSGGGATLDYQAAVVASRATLATLVGYSEATVKRAVADLWAATDLRRIPTLYPGERRLSSGPGEDPRASRTSKAWRRICLL
jgi:hypothetical protein